MDSPIRCSLCQSRTFQKESYDFIYSTIVLRAVLCGFETWFRRVREEQRLGKFENTVVKRTVLYEHMRQEVKAG